MEIQGRVSNRTPLPQTFLWWANPAVEVNDDYQSVFPPDVNAVFDHGKRAVSSFPIATGTYYKMDYSAGVDISNYKNIKVPTSYMAVNSKYDFEGGYENDTHGGMLHVASHHFSPGKKQWTWGNGDFGRAWDRNLTDEAPLLSHLGGMTKSPADDSNNSSPKGEVGRGLFRPYIELMAGVYTENQPDFSWLMPYEEKQFVQYFMPYRELGMVKQASKDFILNIESRWSAGDLPASMESKMVTFKVLATSRQEVQIVLRNKKGEVYFDKVTTLSPEEVFEETVDVKDATINDLLLTVSKSSQTALPSGGVGGGLLWAAEPDDIRPIPDAAEAALPPVDTKTNDQLYLTGLHLEQYRHATWSAFDYYEEALRRDPNDVRCLNQMGLWYLRRGRFDKAEAYLRKAVKIWQKRNPNPYDGEAIFNLGLCLKYKWRLSGVGLLGLTEPYELFWKSTWNKAWADAGYFESACISVGQARYDDALDELNRSLVFNSCNHKARALKATVLRKLNERRQKGSLQMGSSKELNERLSLIKESLRLDRFNYGIRYEQYLLTKDKDLLKELKQLLRKSSQNYDELALDYMQAGCAAEAIDIWTLAEAEKAVTPMTYYYMAYAKAVQGKLDEANACIAKAEACKADYCFPNRLEDVLALEMAKQMNPDGARAPYYLGCLYYDKRQYDVAVSNWELSARLDPQFPTVWRNLALAKLNHQEAQPSSSADDALEYMERAFSLNDKDSRILMELDQLYKRLHRPHQERLDFLRKHPKLIAQRDDLVLEEITLLNQLGRYEEAMAKLDAHRFHPWEGGEGKVPAQYQYCRLELAKQALSAKHYDKAVSLLQECLEYPHHLGEGKLYGAQENDFYYYLGVAYDALGQNDKARECWEEATKGPQEPAAAMYYNDAKPDKIFYQGMALLKLGREDEAHGRFYRLINYGKQHLFEKQVMDYFAVSLPDLLIWNDSLDTKNRIHCLYMLALGYYGLGNHEKAGKYLAEVKALDNNHQGISLPLKP